MSPRPKTLTVKLHLTDETKIKPLQAYLYSSGGKLLGTSSISAEKPAVFKMSKNMEGRAVEVILGPETGQKLPATNLKALKRAGAYSLPGKYFLDKPEFEIKIPGAILPVWCLCHVSGRVIKQVILPDGSVEEVSICNARVHICEVDPWFWILRRIPDYKIFKLRDDLLDIFYPVKRPISGPIPDPGPYLKRNKIRNLRRTSTTLLKKEEPAALANVKFTDPAQQLALNGLINARNVKNIRDRLGKINNFFYPYWCMFSYLWPYFRRNCIRTVDVDCTGRFNSLFFYDCKDKPDLYFWVEQLQDGAWVTVYKPNIACNTHWNYDCGTEIIINAPNAVACEVPTYDVPDGVTLFVLPYKIADTHIYGNPNVATACPDGWLRPDGMINYEDEDLGMLYDAPFGGTLRFYHDDSAFIPKEDTDPGAADNSIKFYRYSYRREGDAEWTAMTTTQSRSYRMEYNDGTLPTYEKYPVPPQTIGGESNLFEFKPRTPPARPIDPPTVIAREWVTGNLDDVAASWDTNATVPAMDDTNTTDDAGTFEVLIEVFNSSGQKVMPGSTTFEFLALNADTHTTRYPETYEIVDGGFVFKVHIDNNSVTAALPQPSIEGIPASDNCGFLRYDELTDPVHVEFEATHPNDRAVFDFTIKRGTYPLGSGSTAGIYTETSSHSATPYDLDIGTGLYENDFSVIELVEECLNGAFAADLRVWGKATDGRNGRNGRQRRLGIYERRVIAFALAEAEDDE